MTFYNQNQNDSKKRRIENSNYWLCPMMNIEYNLQIFYTYTIRRFYLYMKLMDGSFSLV